MKIVRIPAAALVAVVLSLFTVGSLAQLGSRSAATEEPSGLANFRASVDGHVVPVVVELREPAAARAAPGSNRLEQLAASRQVRTAQQDALIASLPERGIRLWPMAVAAKQVDGSVREVRFRNATLSSSFGAYVAEADLEKLRALPEVRAVRSAPAMHLGLNKSVTYMLGPEFEPADRRLAVYGATEELDPLAPGSEAPPGAADRIDGFEGQGIYTAIIDSGTDWRHPMFGGTGLSSPLPTVPGNAAAPTDHQKIVYYYNLSGGEPDDDHGHGTHTASTSAGYRVDGDTPGQPGFGTGPCNTVPPTNCNGIGPTIDGEMMHGVSPAARVLGYKMCNIAGSCVAAGGVEFAIEDAVSPTALRPETGQDTGVAKPVADVISMSLSGGTSPTDSSSVTSNNAFLSGAIIVAAASNDGPGASTTGAPCVGTMAICVAANLDPGSIAAVDVLAAGEIPGETAAGTAPVLAGPAEETGADSVANAPNATERQAMRAFDAAGGGPIPEGSVSAHYIFIDQLNNNDIPAAVENRIALVEFSGTFAAAANRIAPLNPAAILLITDTEAATAVAVANSIPTFTFPEEASAYLLDLMRSDDDDSVNPPHGTVSELPIRVSASAALESFPPGVAGFSGRGPRSDFRIIKPDISAPGVGVVAATTPEGNPSAGIGMASPSGYTSASGTSMATPHVSGGMALVRQYVRSLGFDSTDVNDPNYLKKRYEAATIARALAQNTATNLRGGRGDPEASDVQTVNDVGSGLMNLSGALDGKAIFVAPTTLMSNEFSAAAVGHLADSIDEAGNLEVLLPTYSFGEVQVAGAPRVVSKAARAIIRDITAGGGAGNYALTWDNNLRADLPSVDVNFLALDGVTPITSVTVPSGGSAEFLVQISVDGTQYALPNSNISWYVTATHTASGRTLRMPYYLRAIAYVSPLLTAPPIHDAPTDVETPATAPDCSVDNDSAYTLNFSYELPEGGDTPTGFRIQEGTSIAPIFDDPADEPLVGGANSLWAGSEQWNSSPSPDSGSSAYYVPNAVDQNEALTMIDAVTLPASASLSFDSTGATEADFDFAVVELVVDGSAVELARYTGPLSGRQVFDLTPWGGNDVRVRFRMSSDLLLGDEGWWVDNIRIDADDFSTIGEVAAEESTYPVTGRGAGTRFYRVAGIFDDEGDPWVGPYSTVHCVTVDVPANLPLADAGGDLTANEGASVSLDGTGSSDPDGGTLTFAWTQTAGPAVSLSGADSATPSFTAPDVDGDTDLAFELEVTNEADLSATDTVVVRVFDLGGNTPPVADAGTPFTIAEGKTARLNGAGTDAEGHALTYQWSQTGGSAVELQNADSAQASFVAPEVDEDTPLEFTLTVTDELGASAAASVVVTVTDELPGATQILGGALGLWTLLVTLSFAGLQRRRRRG